jgi:hypothetical protein
LTGVDHLQYANGGFFYAVAGEMLETGIYAR